MLQALDRDLGPQREPVQPNVQLESLRTPKASRLSGLWAEGQRTAGFLRVTNILCRYLLVGLARSETQPDCVVSAQCGCSKDHARAFQLQDLNSPAEHT